MFYDKSLKELVKSGEIAVFASGIAGLGLQILAGRLLVPEFGSSVYTWGSIIGVFMVALSVGYHIGGKTAEKATKRLVANILLISALFICLLTFFGQSLTKFFGDFDISAQYAALPAVLVLFAPIVFLYGLLTPYAVTLSRQAHKGQASGKIFSLDTIGSIIGSFGATFILIPTFSTSTSFVVIGLIILSTAILILPKDKLAVLSAVSLSVILVVSIPWNSSASTDDKSKIVFETETLYQKLEIKDHINGVRVMLLDGHPQSAMLKSAPLNHVYRFSQYFHFPQLLNNNIKSVLVVGAGGFTVPKIFSHMGMEVDVVELDQGVVDAGKYFHAEDYKMNTYVMDGRKFITKSDKKYDLIVLDAYRKDRIPFHMTTIEFFELVKSRLTERGIVYTNLHSSVEGEGSLFYRTQYKTLESVFPTVYSFATSKNPMFFQNIGVMASKDQWKVPQDELHRRSTKRSTYINLTRFIDMLVPKVNTSDVDILTDQKAPVDKLLTSMVNVN